MGLIKIVPKAQNLHLGVQGLVQGTGRLDGLSRYNVETQRMESIKDVAVHARRPPLCTRNRTRQCGHGS